MGNNMSQDYELIAKALFENYEVIYDIDLETSAYISFHESESYRRYGVNGSRNDFFREFSETVNNIVSPRDRDYVISKLKRENLVKGLDENRYYTFVYRVTVNGKETYHQLRAAYQPEESGTHVFMGIQDVDYIIRQEQAHKTEVLKLQQKESNHLKAVLASAAAYMEVNLTKDAVLEKSDDKLENEKRFIKKLPSIEEIPEYSRMHSWICDDLIVEGKENYRNAVSRENLLELFSGGEMRATVTFSVFTKEGGLQPLREVAFLYKEEETKDVFAFCVIYDLTQQQKREREITKLENELRMSRIHNFTSQMQPHFLYNALGSIQEVMLIDAQRASDLLGDFTVHLRSCIRAMTKDEPLAFSQELENVKAYINIEKMRFGDKLRVHYEIESLRFSILPLTVQPIVENAIRHGIYGRGVAGGDVYIRTHESSNEWTVQVQDNGVGFDVNEYFKKQNLGEGESTGLKNIRFRLEKVMGASMDVESEEGTGTMVTIRIPKGARDESDYC